MKDTRLENKIREAVVKYLMIQMIEDLDSVKDTNFHKVVAHVIAALTRNLGSVMFALEVAMPGHAREEFAKKIDGLLEMVKFQILSEYDTVFKDKHKSSSQEIDDMIKDLHNFLKEDRKDE